jgi:hypothetical protein
MITIIVADSREGNSTADAFAAGSILDRIWTRWRSLARFHANAETTRSKPISGCAHTTQSLRRKLKALRLMAERGISAVPKVPIVQMLIIAEYRNLIHTKRRMEFAFEVNWYVAACILTFINQIASHWSPDTARRE